MKKLSLLIVTILITASAGFAQKYGFVDTEYILNLWLGIGHYGQAAGKVVEELQWRAVVGGPGTVGDQAYMHTTQPPRQFAIRDWPMTEDLTRRVV